MIVRILACSMFVFVCFLDRTSPFYSFHDYFCANEWRESRTTIHREHKHLWKKYCPNGYNAWDDVVMMSIVLSKLDWYGILPPRHSSEMYTYSFYCNCDRPWWRTGQAECTRKLAHHISPGIRQPRTTSNNQRRFVKTQTNHHWLYKFLKGTQEYLFIMKIVGAIVLSLHLASAFVARDGRLASR